MAWARLDDGFHDHPKVLALLERGTDGLAAIGMWTVTRTWTARHNTAFIGERTASKVTGASLVRTRKLAALLLDVGLFDRTTDEKLGWNLHDADDYSRDALSAKRSEAGKKGAESRWSAERGSDGKSQDLRLANSNGNAEVANGKPDGKPDSSPLARGTRARPVPSRPDRPDQPQDSGHLDDDDSRNAPAHQASSSSKTPTALDLEQLAAAIAGQPDIGPGTDWSRLEPDAIGRIARWLDTHGQDRLVQAARIASRGRQAPASPTAWFSVWAKLTTTPAEQKPEFCQTHALEHPTGSECRSCRADRLAGDDPDDAKPAIGGGTPMPADIRDQVKAAITPLAPDPKPQEEPEPVTVPPAAPTDPPF